VKNLTRTSIDSHEKPLRNQNQKRKKKTYQNQKKKKKALTNQEKKKRAAAAAAVHPATLKPQLLLQELNYFSLPEKNKKNQFNQKNQPSWKDQ
jgi:hypothetical protein